MWIADSGLIGRGQNMEFGSGNAAFDKPFGCELKVERLRRVKVGTQRIDLASNGIELPKKFNL
jgi:hypothetical protein